MIPCPRKLGSTEGASAAHTVVLNTDEKWWKCTLNLFIKIHQLLELQAQKHVCSVNLTESI